MLTVVMPYRMQRNRLPLSSRLGTWQYSGSVVMALPRWYFRVQKQPVNITITAVKPGNCGLSLGQGKSDVCPGFRGEYGRASLYIHV